MMGRKKFVGALVVGAMGGTPAMADVFSERIVQQLEQQGFTSISTERTWLGRTRIVAEGRDGQREIIVNPNTGEILRDLLLAINAGSDSNGDLVSVSDRTKDDGKSQDDNDDNDDEGGSSDSSGGGDSGSDRDGNSGGSGGGNGGDSD